MSTEPAPPPAATDPPTDPAAAPLSLRVREATALLEAVAADATLLGQLEAADRARLQQAIAHAFLPDRKARRERQKAAARRQRDAEVAHDDALLDATGIRVLRSKPVFTTPNVFPPQGFVPHDVHDAGASFADAEPEVRHTRQLQHCYVCKAKYTRLHHFYDQLCEACGDLNFRKRTETADLRGRVALLTGGRVKIGYQAGLKLLRAGCALIVTTRFPRDSAARYAQELDFADWSGRLEIFGLDLRHTPSVEAFCDHLLATRDRLDFIVNNACQTVRRPPGFYAHMMDGELAAEHDAPAPVRALLGAYEGLRAQELVGAHGEIAPVAGGLAIDGIARAAALSQLALLPGEREQGGELFPEGRLDKDLQQVDLRTQNSWRMRMHEVPTVEVLETQLVNAVAPFLLNARLKPLMLRTPERDKHIVNVSAMEGQFYRNFKTTRHPHTNMAKAALNMMTRTSAADYHADGIHMNAVDTGWVTDEDPVALAEKKVREERFHPPLDIVDGAARIVDPIIAGALTGEHVWGQFLKDYAPTDW